MVQFAYTILYDPDVTKSIEFYERAFSLHRKFITPDNSYGELLTGTTVLSFASLALAASNLKDGFQQSNKQSRPFAMEIGFSTLEVEAVYEQALKAGAESEAEPQLKPHGQTVAYVRDPDGFLIEICSPME
jgi:uncharacterized glyoxalase superfamily protein PhnB